MFGPLASRREFLKSSVAVSAAVASTTCSAAIATQSTVKWKPKYIVGSCMYGSLYIGDILPEVAKCGAAAIDIWPKPHGNQREQMTDFGEELFGAMLKKHNVQVGCLTHYKLGPFRLQEEMKLAKRLGCHTIVTGGEGPVGLTGTELKSAVRQFVEKLKPHLEVAEVNGVTVAIENHANNLIDSADSLRYLVDLCPSKSLGVALAPYHLPQDAEQLASLIREIGGAMHMFYAWQHGVGCMVKQPKDQELLQMPGRGNLDFKPLVEALADIDYQGWTEIFMHPFPRGISILETAAEVTAEINRAREYLAKI